MQESIIRRLLKELASGVRSVDEVVDELRVLPYVDLGFAKVDHHRELRTGLPETVYGPGKTRDQVREIVQELLRGGSGPVLVTRATSDQAEAVLGIVPDAQYHEPAGLVVVRSSPDPPVGVVLVASAGTSDEAVATEAAATAEAVGLKVERLKDVGVAGLHRLLAHQSVLQRADVIIVVAGMDGVLPSVVGGLSKAPVVAVPTSVGYGAGAGGIAPLLTMLNSCAPGVVVVNIDNGYGAAVFARLMLSREAHQ